MDYIGSLIELVAVLIRSLVNDRATKLIKDQKTKETYYKAYDFLKVCHNSWSLDFKATTKEEPLLRDYINNFEKNLKRDDHFIYYFDKRRLGSYIIIARRHARLWSKPNSIRSKFNVFRIKCCQKKILKMMKRLAIRLGILDDYKQFLKRIK